MAGFEALELAARKRGQNLGLGPAELFDDGREKPFGQNVDLAANVGGDILVLGVKRDGHVGRERPRSRRPDDDVGTAAGKGREFGAQVGDDREADVDRGRNLVPVLDLGLGQGGPAVDAPMDGTLALVNIAVFEEGAQVLEDLSLVGRMHSQVGRVPGAQDAEALELVPLDADEPLGVLPAFLADGRHGHGLFLVAELAGEVADDLGERRHVLC